jgi:hypothetical protein
VKREREEEQEVKRGGGGKGRREGGKKSEDKAKGKEKPTRQEKKCLEKGAMREGQGGKGKS